MAGSNVRSPVVVPTPVTDALTTPLASTLAAPEVVPKLFAITVISSRAAFRSALADAGESDPSSKFVVTMFPAVAQAIYGLL